MAFSLHLEASRPCVSDNGYHEGYAYYLDEDGKICFSEMDRTKAAGRQILRLLSNAEEAVGEHKLSALSVVRFCGDHDNAQARREFVRAAVLSHTGIVGYATAKELHFDTNTGIGAYSSGMGDGPLVVLPYVDEQTSFNIVLAQSTGGRRLYVAQQQGGVFEPEYVRLAPPKP